MFKNSSGYFAEAKLVINSGKNRELNNIVRIKIQTINFCLVAGRDLLNKTQVTKNPQFPLQKLGICILKILEKLCYFISS